MRRHRVNRGSPLPISCITIGGASMDVSGDHFGALVVYVDELGAVGVRGSVNSSPESRLRILPPCAVVESPGSLICGMATIFLPAISPSPFRTRLR
jgi:hypothetical protein